MSKYVIGCKFIACALLFMFFLISSVKAEKNTLRVSILDTGFCIGKVQQKHKNLIIKPPVDLTNEVTLDCNKFNVRDRRFHGQLVLNELVRSLDFDKLGKRKIIITPYVIFNKSGRQSLNYWHRAFSDAVQNSTDLYLVAAGFPMNGLTSFDYPEISTVTFVASGRIGRGILRNTKLWPHELVTTGKLFIIGSYYPAPQEGSNFFDKGLLYQNRIDYYFSSGEQGDRITGTSKSVAISLGTAINICLNGTTSVLKLRQCLKSKRKKIVMDYKKNSFWTF